MNKPPRKAARAVARIAPEPHRPRVSDRLVRPLADGPPEAPADYVPVRHDGWNADRIRIFLEALAACGVVGDAARAAGMSRRSAYNLRYSAKGRGFHIAWNAALLHARQRLEDELMSRALHGCVELIVRDGQVWGERHRFDNKHSMALLAWLDRKVTVDDNENGPARDVGDRFSEFVDIVCTGDPKQVDDFVESRRKERLEANALIVRFVDSDGTPLPDVGKKRDPREA